jgi:hypothetical protein
MLSRKYVTPTAVTIANSGQAGARISPECAQQLQPEMATHEPPPCAPKPASHHPLPKLDLHHQAENTNAAQSHHRNKPSRRPKRGTEALAAGQSKPPPSRLVQTDLTAVQSHRSSVREPRRLEDRRAPSQHTRRGLADQKPASASTACTAPTQRPRRHHAEATTLYHCWSPPSESDQAQRPGPKSPDQEAAPRRICDLTRGLAARGRRLAKASAGKPKRRRAARSTALRSRGRTEGR